MHNYTMTLPSAAHIVLKAIACFTPAVYMIASRSPPRKKSALGLEGIILMIHKKNNGRCRVSVALVSSRGALHFNR